MLKKRRKTIKYIHFPILENDNPNRSCFNLSQTKGIQKSPQMETLAWTLSVGLTQVSVNKLQQYKLEPGIDCV